MVHLIAATKMRMSRFDIGSIIGLEGVDNVVRHTQKIVVLEKNILFHYSKTYGGRQTGSKKVPDLVESIMKKSDPVKEGSWRILFK